MLKVLGICGSPRAGSTEFILKKALTKMRALGFAASLFTVKGKNIQFCLHCDHCLKNGKCVSKDDMEYLYDILRKADGVIIATPVYNGGLSAQTKTVMDRCRALLASDRDALRFKVGMGIAVGGDRDGGQELALQQIHAFYILNGMLPVSGGFFGANLGATFWSKDTKSEASKDEEGFRTLDKTTKRFAELLKKTSKLRLR